MTVIHSLTCNLCGHAHPLDGDGPHPLPYGWLPVDDRHLCPNCVADVLNALQRHPDHPLAENVIIRPPPPNPRNTTVAFGPAR